MSLREYSKSVWTAWKDKAVTWVIGTLSLKGFYRLMLAMASAQLLYLEKEGIIQLTPQYHSMSDVVEFVGNNWEEIVVRTLDVNTALIELELDDMLMQMDKKDE